MLSQKLSRIELKEADFEEYWSKVKTPDKESETAKKQTQQQGDHHTTKHSTPPNNN